MIDKYGIVIKYKEYNTNDVYSWTYDIKHDPVSIFITSGKENKKNKKLKIISHPECMNNIKNNYKQGMYFNK